jgi:hypothetical protein
VCSTDFVTFLITNVQNLRVEIYATQDLNYMAFEITRILSSPLGRCIVATQPREVGAAGSQKQNRISVREQARERGKEGIEAGAHKRGITKAEFVFSSLDCGNVATQQREGASGAKRW